MRTTIIFVINILVLCLLELILRIVIREGVADYFRDFDFYSFKLDILVCGIIALSLILFHAFLFAICFKQSKLWTQSIATGVIVMLTFYVLSALFGGFIIYFKITMDTIKGLVPILLAGLIQPFLKTMIKSCVSSS